jgi:outer membrane lipoprotein-sorting protein
MIRIILSCLILLGFASTAQADPRKDALVLQIEKYFDGLKTYQADLVQQNADASVSKGKFFLSRPSKFRFQYSEPKEMIYVSDGSVFIEYDPKEDVPNFLPLDSTPASIVMREKVKLSGDVTVRDIRVEGGLISAVLFKTAEPDVGSITMVFQEKPMHLVGWVVDDGQGNVTKVSLRSYVENQPIKDNLFETSRITR